MKIYNYSDLPVVIGNQSINSEFIRLSNDIRKPFVTHNGFQFTSNQNTEDRNIIYTIITKPDGSYGYMEDIIEPPNIYPVIGILFLSFAFLILIKLVQKLKTR